MPTCLHCPSPPFQVLRPPLPLPAWRQCSYARGDVLSSDSLALRPVQGFTVVSRVGLSDLLVDRRRVLVIGKPCGQGCVVARSNAHQLPVSLHQCPRSWFSPFAHDTYLQCSRSLILLNSSLPDAWIRALISRVRCRW